MQFKKNMIINVKKDPSFDDCFYFVVKRNDKLVKILIRKNMGGKYTVYDLIHYTDELIDYVADSESAKQFIIKSTRKVAAKNAVHDKYYGRLDSRAKPISLKLEIEEFSESEQK